MTKKIKIKNFLFLVAILYSYTATSQEIVAENVSNSGAESLSTKSAIVYSIAEDMINLFQDVSLNSTEESLSLLTHSDIQYISIYIGDEIYLEFMPVLSSKLNLSLSNFEPGSYEIVCYSAENIAPSILQVNK